MFGLSELVCGIIAGLATALSTYLTDKFARARKSLYRKLLFAAIAVVTFFAFSISTTVAKYFTSHSAIDSSRRYFLQWKNEETETLNSDTGILSEKSPLTEFERDVNKYFLRIEGVDPDIKNEFAEKIITIARSKFTKCK